MKPDRILVLMFGAWCGGVTCDQAVMALTAGHVIAACIWASVGAALAGLLILGYRRT